MEVRGIVMLVCRCAPDEHTKYAERVECTRACVHGRSAESMVVTGAIAAGEVAGTIAADESAPQHAIPNSHCMAESLVPGGAEVVPMPLV